ncbi:MAG: hypothetical protein DI582_08145 [Azospirillum brasilense]|nr:MAG: hypothetical protein DI582_08145 [Azospirillum brasilense]
MRQALCLLVATLMLAGCGIALKSYEYVPQQAGEYPAVINSIYRVDSDEEIWTGAKKPLYWVRLRQIDGGGAASNRLFETDDHFFQLSPGPHQFKFDLRGGEASGLVDMQFVAQPGEGYRLFMKPLEEGKYAVLILNRAGEIAAEKQVQVLRSTGTYSVPIRIPTGR